MNAAELPMILFTVLAQMSVGAYLTLGLIQVCGRLRKESAPTVDRVTRATLFSVGPLLVLGFFAAFFHLNDPLHALNTFRNAGSSWLSREILFGVVYGTLGMVYTLAEWLQRGARPLRQVLAALTALAGVGLIVSMTCVYYSVDTIPAWHTPATWFLFAGSALLTGPLAVSVSLLFSWTSQVKRDTRGSTSLWSRLLDVLQVTSHQPMSQPVSSHMSRSIQQAAIVSCVAGTVLLVTYPLYVLHLAGASDDASAHVLQALTTSPVLAFRLMLLAVVILLVIGVAYQRVKPCSRPSHSLVWILTLSYVLAVTTEIAGRILHYEGLFHVGVNTLQSGLGL